MFNLNARQSAMLLQLLSGAAITTACLQMKRNAHEKAQDGKQHGGKNALFSFFLDYMLLHQLYSLILT